MQRLLLLFFCLPALLAGQFVAPPASPPASTSVTVGYTELGVDYHRPSVRGRRIFGELLPYGKRWRAGANENTLLTLSRSVRIGDRDVEAGTYSIFLIPSEDGDWTWIINQATDNWGDRGYRENLDVARITAMPQRLTARTETLEYRWMNLTHQSADLVLEWEWVRLRLPIRLNTDEQVSRQAVLHLNPAGDGDEYYEAARYYYENGNLKRAKAWIDRWAAAKPAQFGRSRRQALIEYGLGNRTAATRIMERSLELAREAGNDHYVRMNEQSLREWKREPTDLHPDTLLSRSLAYHDPGGRWARGSHLFNLVEHRPGASLRHSRVTLYPTTDEFDLYQIRDRDKLHYRYLDGNYEFSHQGRTEIPDSVRTRLRLTEERTAVMRDYYSYLWGLPMKLRDAGTLPQPTVHRVWYDGRELLELEVRYAPETGEDVWFFLFDPETYALSGYRFYHAADGPGTGEYILLEGEATVDGVKLPRTRHWYATENNLYLGTDELID